MYFGQIFRIFWSILGHGRGCGVTVPNLILTPDKFQGFCARLSGLHKLPSTFLDFLLDVRHDRDCGVTVPNLTLNSDQFKVF